MIGSSAQLIAEIAKTTRIVEMTEIVGITGIASSNPQIRRRRDHSIALSM
jgi:hypothetical protein